MKKLILATAAALTLALSGCSAEETTTEETISSTTEETTTTTEKTTSSTAEETTTTTETPVVVEEPTSTFAEAPTVSEEPYVVECLPGTPGPARMSDGTTQHSDYCFEILGGDEYLANENWHSSPDNPALAEHYAEQERLANTPYADGGTCAAAICGYGTNDQGQRNPSSGELQMWSLCENDREYVPENINCDDYAWVAEHQY